MVDVVCERVFMPLEDFNSRKGSCGDSFLTEGYCVCNKVVPLYIRCLM